MPALVMEDRRRSNFRDSDAYNRLQAPGTIVWRGHTTQTAIGSRGELLRVLVVDDYRRQIRCPDWSPLGTPAG